MTLLSFSNSALRDLERLRDFLRTKNLPAARRAATKILQSLRSLEQNPEMGRQVVGRPAAYRELVIPFGRDGYIAAYRYTGDALVVLGIRHQREIQPLPTPPESPDA